MKLTALEDLRHTMEQCNHCGQCKWILGPKTRGFDFAEVCPIHMRFGFDAYSGQGLLNIAQEIVEGTLAITDDLVEAVYSCTTCGACDTNCKSVRDMEVLETILALRRHIVESAAGPLAAHRPVADSIAATHNIHGLPHEQRFAWLDSSCKVTQGATTAYYVGDLTAYKFPELARNTCRILTAVGVPFTVLGPDEWNDGDFLWRTGQAKAAQATAEHNIAAMKVHGIKTVICSDAQALSVMRDFYPRIAQLEFQTLHITEVVKQALDAGHMSFARRVERKVSYHDSCHLGRLSETYITWEGEIRAFNRHIPEKKWRRGSDGIYDPPRAILAVVPGLEMVEMVRHAEASFCCGAAGGVLEADPKFARWTAAERLREATAAGVEAVICCAPLCQSNLLAAAGVGSPAIVDISEIILEAL